MNIAHPLQTIVVSLLISVAALSQTDSNSTLDRVLTPSQTQTPAPTSEDATAITEPSLQRFGYNLFQSPDAASELLMGGALPSDYQLGPGDHLGIYLGGKAQETFDLTVSVDGKLFMPTVGVMGVTGLTLDEFRSQLDSQLRSVYSDYTLNIMLLRPKRLGVSVIGEVRQPGNHTGSALSTVLDFVSMAGGPTEYGSLRDIQVFRRDSLVARIDLYDYLLRPQGYQTFSLQSGDKIFVPVVSSIIEVSGQVNREAIYELNPHKQETVCDLIELAGGFTGFAYRHSVEWSRLEADGLRRVKYVDFTTNPCADAAESLILRDNDRIHVFSIADQAPQDSLQIHGEVNEPGKYPFQKNMRVSQLILQAGGLKRSAYVLEAEVAKVDPGNPLNHLKVNLNHAMQGDTTHDIILEPDDHVFVRKIPKWEVGALVNIVGEVKFPGMYPIVNDSTYLSQLIAAAGGFTEEAFIREARLIRESETTVEDKELTRLLGMNRADMSESEYEYLVMKQNTGSLNEIVIDFYDLFINNNRAEDVRLADGDVIRIPKHPNVVYVSGRVSSPGGILFQPGQGFDYYIDQADGFTWDADKRRTKIIKVTGEIRNARDIREFEPGDRIWVPRKKDRDYWQIFYDSVIVLGQLAAVYLVIQRATE